MKNKRKNCGLLITFEGVETSGKSTHARLLKRFLDTKKIKNILTMEPGGTVLGKKVKNLILQPPGGQMGPRSELLLFAVDRAEHVRRRIKPALLAGQVVICDRYIDSTTAYQVGGRGLPSSEINFLNDLSSEGLVPDVTFLLYLDLSEMKKRLVIRGRPADRFEKEKLTFHQKIQKEYLKIARGQKRFIILNGSEPIEKNAVIIRNAVGKKISGIR